MSQQQEAYDFVTSTFIKLLEQDDRISYEHKRSVLAFYEDMFSHEGVRNNMLQAFSNFLDEIDKRMNASRKAGIVQAKDALLLELQGSLYPSVSAAEIEVVIEQLLASESAEEETIPVSEDMDLTEVGGGDEDDTPLL